MIGAQIFLFTILQTILFSKTINCDELRPPCPMRDLTEKMAHSSASVSKSGYIFSKNETWFENGRRLSCPCVYKTYLSFCCSPEVAQLDVSGCSMDNAISSMENGNGGKTVTMGKCFHPITRGPCVFGWMAPLVIYDFEILQNGSILASDYDGGLLLDSEHYCLFRTPESANLSAKVCREWVRMNCWNILSLVISILITLTTFIGYMIRPKLKNLNGLIFKSYVATYIGFYLCALGAQLTSTSPCVHLFTIFGRDSKMMFSAGIIAISFGLNTFFYVSTGIRLRHHKKDITNLNKNVNERNDIDSHWFKLYLKLFIIMGRHLIIWSIWFLWPRPWVTNFFAVLEVVQSFLIFVIFFWKDNVEHCVCNRVSSTLCGI